MQSSRSHQGTAIATLTAIIATLAINTLSNFFPPGGQSVGEIANTVFEQMLFIPANYAFAIWGLIYVGLIAYGIFQLQPIQRRNPNIRWISTLLIAACIAQVLWIFCFTLRLFGLSILAMLGILLPLVWAYLNLGIGEAKTSRKRRWLVQVPFSVYIAWISVATIVNVACALYAAGWSGWGLRDVGWTVIMLVIGGVLAGAVALTRRDLAFVLVYVWAYGAIAVRHASIPVIWISAVGVASLVLGLLAFSEWRHWRYNQATFTRH